MGLSKDSTDVIEDIKILELTAGQKRRLRRKRLRAARAGSLETDTDAQKPLTDLKNILSKEPVANHQQLVSHKKKKLKCDIQVLNESQISISKDPTLISNEKSKCEKLVLPKELKPILQTYDLTVNKNNKSTSKDANNKELKDPISHLINNQYNLSENKIPTLETPKVVKEKSGNDNLVLNKKQKLKSININGNHQIKPENLCQIQIKKDNSDNSFCIENQTAVDHKLFENQKVGSQSQPSDVNQSSKHQNPERKLKSDIPSNKDHVLIEEQIIGLLNSESHIIKSENLKVDDPKSISQKTECFKNIAPTLDKKDMGKVQDTPEPQNQQERITKTESKIEDTASIDKSRDEVKAAREAKKLAKQKAKKKDDTLDKDDVEVKKVTSKINVQVKDNVAKNDELCSNKTETTKTVEPVSDLKCKENIPPSDKGKTENDQNRSLGEKSKEDIKGATNDEMLEGPSKSKAELKAERRAKQEAQRAAKQAAEQKAASQPKDKDPVKNKEEKSPKPKTVEKVKVKTQSVHKAGWFQHLYVEKDKEYLNNISINSNLHPAVVKLGVQLATRVVTGSNARCIALLDAIKKMVRDYSLPARTEVGRGLQTALAAAAAHLRLASPAAAATAAAETNALKHFRRQLTQLPANIDEFDAKKQLQEEIDRYIREQIDMAGEAISLTLRNKISPGDNILTYGCSSLIERVLCSAWAAGVRFRAIVAGARGQRGQEMLRRLRARGLPASYVDISALSYVMNDVQKVLLGAGALLAHGAALGAAGSAQVALVARARNVPVLVACETHKFSERTHVDPLVCHEIGDPDELIDKTDENSPLKDWRSNPNLTLLNVTYDVTPPSLITAVVTELGILPCTSAPVVLRFKQSEYGM